MSMDIFSTSLSNPLQLEPALLGVTVTHGAKSVLQKPEERRSGAFVQAPLILRTLGADRSYKFTTFEMTQNLIFVICEQMGKYPFRIEATIVHGILQLYSAEQKLQDIAFLGKIESISTAGNSLLDSPKGFVLRIIQISFENREAIEKLISSLIQSDAA